MKVVFVDLSAFEGVLPLAAGYMQAYAERDAATGARPTPIRERSPDLQQKSPD